jgi:hypothetical protein
MLSIITNNHDRHFLYIYDVPQSVQTYFDHLDDDSASDGWIHYRGFWYHLSDFMRVGSQVPGNDPFSDWDGYASDSYFSGVLIKVSDDGESYRIATYIN